METTTAGIPAATRTDRVGEAGFLVDHDVVHAADLVVERVMGQGERLPVVLPQSRQIEDLHAVFGGVVGDHEYVVLVDLHVPPARTRCRFGLGKVPDEHRVGRVGDVHDPSPVAASHDGVVAIGFRVGPAPDIVDAHAAGAAQLRDRHVGHEIHRIASEGGGFALGAVDLTTQHRSDSFHVLEDGEPLGPVARATVQNERRPQAVVSVGVAGDEQPVVVGEYAADLRSALGALAHLLDRAPAGIVQGNLIDGAPFFVRTRSARPNRGAVRGQGCTEPVLWGAIGRLHAAALGPPISVTLECDDSTGLCRRVAGRDKYAVTRHKQGSTEERSRSVRIGQFAGHAPAIRAGLIDVGRTRKRSGPRRAHHQHLVTQSQRAPEKRPSGGGRLQQSLLHPPVARIAENENDAVRR